MKTRTRRTLARREWSPQTRARLARAFRLIEEDDHTAAFSQNTAAEVLPFVRRLIAEFDNGADSQTVTEVLSRASDALFVNWEVPAHTEPELAQRGGFYTGFALCWLLLEEQNGGAR